MIHNQKHRIAKMMREIRAWYPYAALIFIPWSKKWRCIAPATKRNRTTVATAQKLERCVRQALKQVRKIRGKR